MPKKYFWRGINSVQYFLIYRGSLTSIWRREFNIFCPLRNFNRCAKEFCPIGERIFNQSALWFWSAHKEIFIGSQGKFDWPAKILTDSQKDFDHYLLLEFFISALADDFSLEFKWQQVSSSLQDSSQYYAYLPNPSARAGYDTRSIFKRSLTGLNSEFSFS